ncbi:MAG: hypothetical protein IKA99_03665 [Clostridia bacterium]|nr:hypothetical protein [Clostridia bacterium]
MNILPLLLIGILLGGEKFSSLKDILTRIDFPSFAPVFQLLGVDKSTVDFLSSEEFSSSIANGDLKSLLPLFSTLFAKKPQQNEDEESDQPQKNCDYVTPIKNVAPTEIGATIENFLG